MGKLGLLVGTFALIAFSGCKKTKDGSKEAKEAAFSGPMPITFGDCAGPKTAWVSGPKPAPFSPDEAKDVGDAKLAADTPSSMDDPPPPEEEDKPDDGEDESGGTGTAMALDEGKMGKKDGDPPPNGGAFASLTGTGDISAGLDDSNIYGGLLGNEAGEMESGFGPGGQGTGWGTIGTGKYGTIGHGAGTSDGRSGAMRGHDASVPTISLGQPNAQGDLDKAIIRRYIKRNVQKLMYCYEKELLAKPNIEGTVSAQFFITPNGEVASSAATGVDKNVSSCVSDVIKSIVFPKPKGGGGVQVNYPFTFRRPADARPKTAKAGAAKATIGTGAGSGSAATTGSAADPAGAGSAGNAAAVAAIPPPPPAKPPADVYKVGVDNPLRSAQSELEACFRKGKKPYGVAVFDLAYDDKGGVNPTVHGIDDPTVQKCVLDVAKTLKATGPRPAQNAERCSVSFGAMPLSAAPSIDVTADAVMLDGAKQGTIAELSKEDALLFKIPSLYEALEARMRTARASVVTIDGPLAIKAIDAAKMNIVNKVVATSRAAGADFVLAYQGGAPDWQLLTPVAYPLVPVPLGTGDFFSYIRVRRDAAMLADASEVVRLSVLVQSDKIWVGISRVNEFQELPLDVGKLGPALAEHKTSAFFADRQDIEIAGDPGASYIDVIKVIKAAQAAGFTNWQLVHPLGLSARPQQ